MDNQKDKYFLDRRELAKALPEDAFKASPGRIIIIVFHVTVAYLCFRALIQFHSWWQILILGFIAGHSLTCMGFVAHELSHGMIVKGGKLRSILESIFWSLVFVSPTMWNRTHNSTHHKHYGTLGDTDRMFTRGEETRMKRFYARFLYPNSEVFPWNPLVLLYQVPYFTRNTIAAFLKPEHVRKFSPACPSYRNGDGKKVLFDLLMIVLIQTTLLWAAGFRFDLFLPMAIVTQITSSCIVMVYVFTNHFLHSIQSTSDPLLGSSSIIVPKWMDRLHSHFSFHTEHHVFPSLRSKYYPFLGDLLREKYPKQYHRIPIWDAWQMLWKNKPFLEKPSENFERR